MRHRGDWEDDPAVASEVHVTRLDVPFFDLTWFFVKSSLAMAVAFMLTSWLWVLIGTAVCSLGAGLLWLVGVPRLLAPPAPPPEPAAVVMPASPPPPPETAAAPAPVDVPAVVPPVPPPPLPARPDPNAAATRELQRQELERRRQGGGQ
jgi:hypothetical protein